MLTVKFINIKNIILLFSFYAFILSSGTKAQVIKDILGHSGAYYSKKYFQSSIGRVITDVGHTSNIKLEDGSIVKGINGVSEIETKADQGSWKITLTGFIPSGSGKIDIRYANCIVMNFGNQFVYAFYSQPLNGKLFDKIEKQLADVKEDFIDEYDDVNVVWERDGQNIVVTGTYQYTEDTDDTDIENRLQFLMNQSRELIREAMKAEKDVKNDYVDELEDKTLKYLDRDDFELLLGGNYYKFFQKKDEAKEGYYNYINYSKYEYLVYNYGDSLESDLWYKVNNLNEDDATEITTKMDEYLKDEGLPDGASKANCYYYTLDDGIGFAVEIMFYFDEKFTGDDFKDYYLDCEEKYLVKCYDKLEDFLDDLQ